MFIPEYIENHKYRAMSDYVSNSELGLLRVSPSVYKSRILDKIGNTFPTKSQKEGTFLHSLLLEPEKFKKDYARLPEGTKLTTIAGKKLKAALEADNADSEIVKGEDFDRLVAAGKSCMEQSKIKDLLDGAWTETCFFWTDPDTGIKCKARADFINPHKDYAGDLKSTSSASDFLKSVLDYGYHRQAAFYLDGLKEALNFTGLEWYWIAVETEVPYLKRVYKADPGLIDVGRQEYKDLLFKLKECREKNEYPGLPEEIAVLSCPDWYLAKRRAIVNL